MTSRSMLVLTAATCAGAPGCWLAEQVHPFGFAIIVGYVHRLATAYRANVPSVL